MINFASIAIPLFLGAILLEIGAGLYKKRKLYHAKDTLANIALGLHAFFHGTMVKSLQLGVYSAFFYFSPLDAGWGVLAWFGCFLGSDFIFYAFHRLGHESRIFWVAHQTHHSSQHFNLSTALRTPFHTLHRWFFWSPLALLGFDPVMILVVDSVCMMYQFFLHTEFVGKLGPLEWVLNTPSHHRVHHACNEEYLDKNYGGALIIWDRLFGTFQAEEALPKYGLIKPVDTHNPAKLAFGEYKKALLEVIRQPNGRAAVRYLFERPGNPSFPDSTNPLHGDPGLLVTSALPKVRLRAIHPGHEI